MSAIAQINKQKGWFGILPLAFIAIFAWILFSNMFSIGKNYGLSFSFCLVSLITLIFFGLMYEWFKEFVFSVKFWFWSLFIYNTISFIFPLIKLIQQF